MFYFILENQILPVGIETGCFQSLTKCFAQKEHQNYIQSRLIFMYFRTLHYTSQGFRDNPPAVNTVIGLSKRI